MLVLSRRIGESVWIGDEIEVVVTEIDNGRCKIGVSAPRSVAVVRAELLPEDRVPTDRPPTQLQGE